jgi:hypothetical protein
MDSDDWESTWTKIEEVSNRASNSFADASMSCLSQKKPLQALHNLLEGLNWFNLRAEARSDSRSGVPPKIDVMHIAGGLDTVRGVLDPETTAAIEDSLARKDAEASAASDANIAQKLELEQYSTMTVQALHGVFYESGLIPCNCTNQEEQFAMTQYHACVLRLDGGWQVPGNSSDRFFECVLAKDDNYEWKKIQFRIPRYDTILYISSMPLTRMIIGKTHMSPLEATTEKMIRMYTQTTRMLGHYRTSARSWMTAHTTTLYLCS